MVWFPGPVLYSEDDGTPTALECWMCGKRWAVTDNASKKRALDAYGLHVREHHPDEVRDGPPS